MNKTVEFELTDDFVLRILRNTGGLKAFFGLLLLALPALPVILAVVGICFAFGTTAGFVAVIVVGALFIMAGCWYWVISILGRRASLATVAALPDRTQNVTFTDEHIVTRGMNSESHSWRGLRSIICNADLWLFQFEAVGLAIPREILDENLATSILTKARECGAKIFRDGNWVSFESENTDANLGHNLKTATLPRRMYLALILALTVILGLVWTPWESSDAKTRSFNGQYTVRPGGPKMIPLKVNEGEQIDLSVVVTSGAPVNVLIAKDKTEEGNKVIFRTVDRFTAEQVLDYHKIEKWEHDTPAIIMLTAADESEVSVKVKLSKAP